MATTTGEDFAAADRPVPAGAAGALLPDARLGARRRGPAAGDAPARLAAYDQYDPSRVGAAHLAVPDRHQRLPDRARAAQPPAAALRASARRPATTRRQPLVRGEEVPWLQPIPDAMVGDPADVVAARGTLRLAFVAAMQLLPARQRAVLILREVLQWPAVDVAAALDMTTAAVNSALQRARARLGEAGVGEDQVDEPLDADHRALVDRYVVAFENADLATLEKLLTDDAVLEMPPFVNWYRGREHYVRFIARVYTLRGTDWRLVPGGRQRAARRGRLHARAGRRVRAAHPPGVHGHRVGHQPQHHVPGPGGVRRASVWRTRSPPARDPLLQVGVAHPADRRERHDVVRVQPRVGRVAHLELALGGVVAGVRGDEQRGDLVGERVELLGRASGRPAACRPRRPTAAARRAAGGRARPPRSRARTPGPSGAAATGRRRRTTTSAPGAVGEPDLGGGLERGAVARSAGRGCRSGQSALAISGSNRTQRVPSHRSPTTWSWWNPGRK